MGRFVKKNLSTRQKIFKKSLVTVYTLYRLIQALFLFLGIITRAKYKNVAMGLLDTLKLIFIFLGDCTGDRGKNFTGKTEKNLQKKIYRKKFTEKKQAGKK